MALPLSSSQGCQLVVSFKGQPSRGNFDCELRSINHYLKLKTQNSKLFKNGCKNSCHSDHWLLRQW